MAGRCRIAVSLGLQLRRQNRLLGIEGVGCKERKGSVSFTATWLILKDVSTRRLRKVKAYKDGGDSTTKRQRPKNDPSLGLGCYASKRAVTANQDFHWRSLHICGKVRPKPREMIQHMEVCLPLRKHNVTADPS
jgi:hypothetical protein